MPEYRSTRILSAVAFVSLAGVFAQSTYGVRAAEECLSKPNSSAPQGQHWYYRIDHANGRQCWRLGPVGLRVQKTAPASEKRSAPAGAILSQASARTQRPATTRRGNLSAEVAPESDVSAPPAPVYWLDASRLLNQLSTVPPAVQQPALEERSAGSPDSPPSAEESPAPARSVVASAGDDLPQAAARAEVPQRIVPSAKPATSIVDDDHTFALLLLMFVTLAIAGPMLHYSERRRRRFAKPVQPQRWASTVIPNEPAADIEMPLAPTTAIDQSPDGPLLSSSSFETERLEKALQQLLDRLQKEHLSTLSAARSARSAEIEMKKSA